LTGPNSQRALTEDMWWLTLKQRASVKGPAGAEEIQRLRTDFCEGTEDTWPDLVDALMHQGIQASLEPHNDLLARSGALCGKGQGDLIEVKICWPDSPAWNAGLRRGDLVEGQQSTRERLTVNWKENAVSERSSSWPLVSGSGHFARPKLTAFPG
jgi:hypothetical protein